jgi:photosystem II stability/assembly factor-like uncharacterized protein
MRYTALSLMQATTGAILRVIATAALVAASWRTATAGPGRWTSNGPYGGSVGALLFDPAEPDIVYAAAGRMGVYRSADGGASWSRACADMDEPYPGGLVVRQLALAATAPEVLFAATGRGLFRSGDGAESWQEVGEGWFSPPESVAPDAADPDTVYVGTNDAGVLKSTDAGQTWMPANTGLGGGSVVWLGSRPGAPATVYASVRESSADHLYRSTDGAATWQAVGTGLPPAYLSEIVFGPAAGEMLASLYNPTPGIYRSDDGGQSWVPLSAPAGYLTALALDPKVPGRIYAGSINAGAHRSDDGGLTWSRIDDPANGFFNANVQSIKVDPADSSRVLIGMWRAGVFRTTDGGVSWTLSNQGLNALSVGAVAIDPEAPGIVYAGTEYGVWKSADDGATWSPRPTGPVFFDDLEIEDLVIDPQDTDTLYAGARGGVWRSTDAGDSWQEHISLFQLGALAMDPQDPQILYAGTEEDFFKTVNGGLTWIPADSGLSGRSSVDIEIDPIVPSTLYTALSYQGGLFKSTNGAASWTRLDIDYTGVHSIALDPRAPLTLYANDFLFVDEGERSEGGGYSSLARTLDGGQSWDEWPTGNRVAMLEVDPRAEGWLYIGFPQDTLGPEGLHHSLDGGVTWEPVIQDGLLTLGIGPLAFDPQDADHLYAGTGDGLYEIDFDGIFGDDFESGDTSAWSQTAE